MISIVSKVILPLPIFLLFFLFYLLGRLKNDFTFGGFFILVFWGIFYWFSTAPGANSLGHIIEKRYYQIKVIKEDPKYIAVLNCGNRHSPDLTSTSNLYPCGLSRVSEGIKLAQKYTGATVIFTGLEPASDEDLDAMANFATDLGLSKSRISKRSTLMEISGDDASDPITNSNTVFVTSANDMPRARHLLNAQGLSPTPVSTDFLTYPNQKVDWTGFIPSSAQLAKSGAAIQSMILLGVAKLTSPTGEPEEVMDEMVEEAQEE
ncbi:ElyC/SanA/YdcF family protein [Algicola sagamiensis]|uniref:ElyC/SanA/YdcF family protein n=1 Tax=Algicola sagamiensis TaxID=163869 RepID=UPI00035F0541|nr:ElyC/SanA/YdcF family protein [Algicola sagamiensis]